MRYALLDTCDPVGAATVFHAAPGTLWLDSADPDHPSSRWSYLCIAPVATLRVSADVLAPGEDGFARKSDEVRRWIRGQARQRIPDGPPFQGGAAGYVSYDAAPLFLERFHSRHAPRSDLAEFHLYDTVLAFDVTGQRTWVMSAGLASADAEEDDVLADARIAEVLARLDSEGGKPASGAALVWARPDHAIDYVAAVERTQDYILDGDIYQANIAQNWVAAPVDVAGAFSNYLEMRERTPAPFAAFGHFAGRILASASPERLISASAEGRVVAEPIKGTVRRKPDAKEDEVAQAGLLASEKDRAENIMITDLLRNDLSVVCWPHSVTVTSLCRLETFSNLHHLVSTIEGDLAEGKDGFDLFAAVFPGGSITGAPKLRAMEIIDALEQRPRGAYCGAIGYVGFDGAMDFNILIRTIDHLPEESTLLAGGGITLMSDPVGELAESELKAERIAPSLFKAGEQT
ncbi:anthranilate synthase component I family protein [uncultured Hyphomonas sp.]|uniref:anthranilate synthase component I family protein n=1 Tax=uncultured Hyphomonas sp. TaxID=225298 RepID=UPI000C4DC658|nr:aminodeoxychorismate/anthranilate synthase component I [Hyphomonadaceae bacterium]|tara:strand:- start:34584 stop:35966 length:1383 start_codon:yes stop_codon:yes gene_type:complete